VRHDIGEIKMMANKAALQDEARIGRYSDFLAGRKLDVVASNFRIQGLYAAGVEPA
jgi:hypothetical protein